MHHAWPLVLLASCSVSVASSPSAPPDDSPAELGIVRWERDLDAGLDRAEAEEKPVLLLFQEVPG